MTNRMALPTLVLAAALLGCGGSPPAAPSEAPAAAPPVAAPPEAAPPAAAPPTAAPEQTGGPRIIKPTGAPARTPLQPGPAAVVPDGPASVGPITELLLARHAEDLPTAATFARHADAPAALRWIAQRDDRLIVMSRAIEALGLWPDDQNRELLFTIAANSGAQVKARAAAWKALASWDLPGDPELHAAAVAASHDPAVPIARAAKAALGQ